MYSPEMRRRAGQGLGNDRELLHMLTMDTGKSQKRTWRTPRKHPTARDRGNLRLGFPQKCPNTSEKVSLVEQSLSLSLNSWSRLREKVKAAGWGGENSLGKRARISPQSYADGPLFPEIQALSFHAGPGHSCWTQETVSGCIQGKSLS